MIILDYYIYTGGPPLEPRLPFVFFLLIILIIGGAAALLG
jgi:hypothetical protein